MRLDELDKKITQSDIDALETFADRIFGKVGIDVEFTRHFLDRVNDDRNGEQITGSELTRLFKQEYKRWGKPIAQMGPDAEAVMKDLQTDINMPFALRWDRDNNELDLIVKTVMRKKDFKTSNKEFPVESIIEDREDRTDVADRLADLANSQITGYFSSEDELHDFMYNELTSDEDYHDGGKTIDWAMGRVNDDVKAWIEESGYRMNGPSGLRSTPTQRSTHKTISLPLRGEKPLRPTHSNNMFRKTLKLSKFTENEAKEIKTKKNPDGFTIDLVVDGKHVGQYTHAREDDIVRNQAEIFPEYRAKGYGTMLLLSAIKTAGDLGLDFEEDTQSLTPAMSRIYDELDDSGMIYGGSGAWAISPSGETELEDFLNESDDFEPHMMYKGDKKKMTKTNDEHIKLGKKGWSHDNPKTKKVEEDSEIWQWNKEDPNNPEVYIQGYGRLMLNQIEDSIVGKLKELTKMAERGNFEQIQKLLDRDVLQLMMKSVVDTKAELQATRKRGGPKSRGINKESILGNTLEDELAEKFAEVKKSVTEYGVGKIVPGVNTTVDVGPNEIKKQAAKFGNKVSKDGLPKKNLR